jgi:hypothetical protein
MLDSRGIVKEKHAPWNDLMMHKSGKLVMAPLANYDRPPSITTVLSNNFRLYPFFINPKKTPARLNGIVYAIPYRRPYV